MRKGPGQVVVESDADGSEAFRLEVLEDSARQV